ncbi:GHKL domain-containing protein [Bombilactobacillus mellis]|uniref:GHKL domain-containing protein n=1 Tax=Bombilactobacillus mellis TaxID=1218508 RepID=UPI002245C502|nr:GHKL domain-containing protein [Bombilactobacillus mellis]MCX0279150.1 GHKL domain-containing protein [Bombilactobacillus mellis]
MKWGNWDAILLAFLAAILQTTVIYNYLALFFKRKSSVSNFIVILIFIINIILSWMTTIFVFPVYINFILSILCWLLFSIVFNGYLSLKAMLITLILSITTALELVSVVLLSYCTTLYDQQIFRIYNETIVIITLSVIFYFLRSIVKRRLGSKQNNKVHSLILFPITNMAIMFILFYNNYLKTRTTTFAIIIVLILNTLVSYIVMNEIDKAVIQSRKNELISQQLVNIQMQNIRLSNQYKLLFNLIHSENRFFLGLYQKHPSSEELYQLLDKRLERVNKVLIKLQDPKKVNSIQMVLDYFVKQAQANNLKVVIEGQDNENITQPDYLLNVMNILTIILSNALEHAKEVKQGEISINYFGDRRGAIYTVVNTFKKNPKIHDYRIELLEQHGLDLQQAHQIVNEMAGEITTSVHDNYFKVEVILPHN